MSKVSVSSHMFVLSLAILAVVVQGGYDYAPAPAPSDSPISGADFCDFACVIFIYDEYCGGAKCVFSTNTTEQYNALCSGTCFEALGGSDMYDCLSANITLDQDIDDIQNNIVNEVYGKFKLF